MFLGRPAVEARPFSDLSRSESRSGVGVGGEGCESPSSKLDALIDSFLEDPLGELGEPVVGREGGRGVASAGARDSARLGDLETPGAVAGFGSGDEASEVRSEKSGDELRREAGEGDARVCEASEDMDWWQIADQIEEQALKSPAPVHPDGFRELNALPYCEDGNLLVYWLDIHEDPFQSPGTLYLFGRAHCGDKTDSICVIVENVERTLHILPRPGVTCGDVRAEFDEVRKRHKISTFMSKEVVKRYAFQDLRVPRGESVFLEVLYPYSQPPVPAGVEGRTFSHVFGANRTALETFIVHRRLMGPGWLVVKNARRPCAPRTWCHWECLVLSPADVEVAAFPSTALNVEGVHRSLPVANTSVRLLPTPCLRVMSVRVQGIMNYRTGQNEVELVSCFVHSRLDTENSTLISKKSYDQGLSSFTIVRKLSGVSLPADYESALEKRGIQVEPTERSLLMLLTSKIQRCDPDVLVGYKFAEQDLYLLLHRMQVCNVQTWSKLGRLRKSNMPRLQRGAADHGYDSVWAVQQATAGRLVCDVYLSALEFEKSRKDCSFSSLVSEKLGAKHTQVDQEQIPDCFATSEQMLALGGHVANEAFLAFQLALEMDVLPLTRQLTEIGGNLWSRSLSGARAERIEYLLLHKFHELNYVLPDKVKSEDPANRKKRKVPAYQGGLVLTPKCGFYDQFVLLLDFNSLYPSVIQEYNICFTTVERNSGEGGEWASAEPPGESVQQGVLPVAIGQLVQKRREIKLRLAKEADEGKRRQLDIRQLAVKLVANSMYGCLGFPNSRFFAMPLAELITRKGREALLKAQEIAVNMGTEVIYGDTDSIMIHTRSCDYRHVLTVGNALKKHINVLFKKLEIEIDAVFKSILLLKKKKYAALLCGPLRQDGTCDLTVQYKGLDLVRRDWCELASDLGRAVLDQILSDKRKEDVVDGIHSLLIEKAAQVHSGLVPLQKYVIIKALNKRLEDYPSNNVQPHVKVAFDLQREGKSVSPGHMIQYVVCLKPQETALVGAECPDSSSFASRSFHPDHVLRANLTVDYEWYLSKQVYPSLLRLCEFVEGVDSLVLARCLGISLHRPASQPAHQSASAGKGAYLDAFEEAPAYGEVEEWTVACPHCAQPSRFSGTDFAEETAKNWHSANFRVVAEQFYSSLNCPACKADYGERFLVNNLVLFMRSLQKRYYLSPFVCTDVVCGNSALHPTCWKRDVPRCTSCLNPMAASYSHSALYNQMLYLRELTDARLSLKRVSELSEPLKRRLLDHPKRAVFEALNAKVRATLNSSRYAWLELDQVFSFYGASPNASERSVCSDE
ncbi:DNA polymerase alpha catalytic subunit-like [Schistocerca gregaria]|uniref:DNA polymerase alpha catalytic subunit-like n=1 Tax=Schistocerca gregaria TaxID=7010 RepID=UPI00211E2B1F|nr:DNA polymerase alpha catalytic subunit-like [Schistocerca gregaria]